MINMIVFLLVIMISAFALAIENPTRIKCSIQGAEDKVYFFDTSTKRYQLSVNEKGRAKSSLSRHIEQQVERSQEDSKKVSYSFQIDDRTEVNVDMDTGSRKGTGQIKLKSKGHTKKFDRCKFVSSVAEEII